jgi:hypothetical protein
MEEEVKKIWMTPEITQIVDVNLETENAFASGIDLAMLAS